MDAVGPKDAHAPGAVGQDWTSLDLVAHLTAWWRREVAQVALIGRGEPPSPHPLGRRWRLSAAGRSS